MYKKNTGKKLENLIETQAEAMRARGDLYIQKVDPPTRTINTRAGKYTTLLPNPFPDFIGCLPSGRMVCIEAKSNQLKNLPFGKTGLRQKQLDDLLIWKSFNAIVGVVWQNLKGFYWVTLDDVKECVMNGRKSVPEDMPRKINSTNGYIINFLEYINQYE